MYGNANKNETKRLVAAVMAIALVACAVAVFASSEVSAYDSSDVKDGAVTVNTDADFSQALGDSSVSKIILGADITTTETSISKEIDLGNYTLNYTGTLNIYSDISNGKLNGLDASNNVISLNSTLDVNKVTFTDNGTAPSYMVGIASGTTVNITECVFADGKDITSIYVSGSSTVNVTKTNLGNDDNGARNINWDATAGADVKLKVTESTVTNLNFFDGTGAETNYTVNYGENSDVYVDGEIALFYVQNDKLVIAEGTTVDADYVYNAGDLEVAGSLVTAEIENYGTIGVAGSLTSTNAPTGEGEIILIDPSATVSDNIDVAEIAVSDNDLTEAFEANDNVVYNGTISTTSTAPTSITIPELGANQSLTFANDISSGYIDIKVGENTIASFVGFSAKNMVLTSGSLAVSADEMSGTIRSSGDVIDISAPLSGDLTLGTSTGTNHFVIQANDELDLNGYKLTIEANVTLTAYGAIVDNNTNSAGSITINQYGTLEYTAIDSDIEITNNGTMKIAEGFGVENNIRTDLVLEDTDNYLTGRTVIQEGATLTIGRNAALDLNGFELVVYGTLVIERNGTINSTGSVENGIAVGGISLMSTGSIQNNNGIIGTDKQIKISNGEDSKDETEQSVAMQGVSGISISLVRSLNAGGERVYNMAVSGDVSRISGVDIYSLTVTNVDVTADMSIGRDVEITVNGATVGRDVTFTHDGEFMTIGTGGLYLTNGATAVFNSPVDGTVSVETGIVGDNTGTVDAPVYVQVEFTGTNLTEPEGVVGMTVSVDRVTYPNPADPTKSIVEQRAYVNGTLDVQSEDDVTSSDTFVNVNLSGTLYVSEALYVPEEVKIVAITSETYVFDVSAGTITAETDEALNYIGAYYAVETTGSNNQKVTTHYYTSFDNAMGAIADAVDTTIVLSGDVDITGTYELTGEQSIENKDTVSSVTVKDGAQITVETDANIDNDAIYTIEGRVIVTEGVGYRPNATIDGHYVYAVKTVETETNTTTYSGFKVAMDNASSGETITVVGDAIYDGNLVIPNGVTVDVESQMDLYVTGNVTVETGGKLILDLGSTLTVGKDQRDSTVTVAGELDASEGGDIVAYSKAADPVAGTAAEAAKSVKVYSTGTSTFAVNKTFAAPVTMNAAYYDDGERVFTTVANAVAYATENALISVHAMGTFSESGAVSTTGVDIIIDDGADVTLGSVTLNDAYIGPTGTGKYTATVSGLSGAGDAATTSTVSVSKTTATVASTVTLNAEGVNQYALSINGIVGATNVSAGTVVYADDTMSVTRENSLTISAGATLLIAEGNSVQIVNTPTNQTYYLVNEGTIQIDGDVSTSSELLLPGTVVIADTGRITAVSLILTGDVTVEADGVLSISSSLQVGQAPEYLGNPATGSVTGEITLDDNAYSIVFAGASIADATFDSANQPESTQFTVNGIVLADVYTVGASTSAVEAVNKAVMGCDDLQNYDSNGDDIAIQWMDGDNVINPVTIGDYDVLNTERGYKDVGIVISIGSHITLSVDNVIVGSAYNGFAYPLSIGTHTVSAIVDPGFSGEITITFNGQTIQNGGTIEVTADMIGEDVVLSASGQLTQDSAVINVGGNGDDGLGLTDILLIVLVILIVIMAIMVALRMMRS